MGSFPPALARGDLHVVEAPLDVSESSLSRAREWLDAAERERALRFVFERDRARFVAAHGFVRGALGAVIGRDPAALRFRFGELGKPYLADDERLRFNLSHSGARVLLAFATVEVGVDVEAMKPDRAFRDVAETVFSPAERTALARRASGADSVATFYRIWTRKEAFIKLLGKGLSMPLDAFDVSAEPDHGLDRAPPGAGDTGRFDLRSIDVGPDYAAAFAVEGRARRVVRWTAVGDLDAATIRPRSSRSSSQ